MIPTLTTDRLTMRGATMDDFPPYAAFYASPRATIIGGPLDLTQAWRKFAADSGHWALKGFGFWTLDDGKGPVGTCGFQHPEGTQSAELGWLLYDRGTGTGFATEAARAALDWAGDRWDRIVSHIDRGNTASQAVALRLGARDTGIAPAHDLDCSTWVHQIGGGVQT